MNTESTVVSSINGTTAHFTGFLQVNTHTWLMADTQYDNSVCVCVCVCACMCACVHVGKLKDALRIPLPDGVNFSESEICYHDVSLHWKMKLNYPTLHIWCCTVPKNNKIMKPGFVFIHSKVCQLQFVLLNIRHILVFSLPFSCGKSQICIMKLFMC